MQDKPLIVVGVDGSACARDALAYAMADAVRRSARVRAVWVFEHPEYWATAYGMPAPTSEFELARRGEDGVRAILDEVLEQGDATMREVPVEITTIAGSPGRVLVAEAAQADLLVVGHRGRGGLASALLGSVGLQCALHAPCPVTVVRPAAGPTDAADVTVAERAPADDPMPMPFP